MNVTLRKIKQDGCFGCEVLGGTINDMKEELVQEGVQLIEHNVSYEPEIASKYGLMGVPALIFERDGQEVARRTGIVPREEILYIIKQVKEGV